MTTTTETTEIQIIAQTLHEVIREASRTWLDQPTASKWQLKQLTIWALPIKPWPGFEDDFEDAWDMVVK